MQFDTAVAKIEESLKQQGFGVVTTIDIQDVFQKKLHTGFRNYKVLGACNPQLAYKAISLESHVGLMLPCNIVIQEHENGEVEVSAINPMETLDITLTTALLTEVATELSNRLRAAIDDLYRQHKEWGHEEALPPPTTENRIEMPMYG